MEPPMPGDGAGRAGVGGVTGRGAAGVGTTGFGAGFAAVGLRAASAPPLAVLRADASLPRLAS
jgi:hypothetical protein